MKELNDVAGNPAVSERIRPTLYSRGLARGRTGLRPSRSQTVPAVRRS